MSKATHTSAPIAAAFERARAEGRVALIPYVMAGYPDEASSEALAVALGEAGADVIELGVAFSDPLADGATIQHASQAALDSGMTLNRALALAARIRERISTPLVLMGYYNPLYSHGLTRFCDEAAAAGVTGLIVPDLPPEEAEPLRATAAARDIELIFLVTPTSPDARIAQVAAAAARTGGGFIYCVSLSGVTGARSDLPDELPTFLARVRAATSLPLAVGFGVSRPEHVARIGGMADGAVIASALINTVDAAAPENRIDAGLEYFRALRSAAQRG
ncbi:MAG TPA: tryptophan synthase subunit alpha [Ktedonobacterales bacterium]